MATDRAPLGPLFSSPTMAARAALVRALALTDELERAQARGDVPAQARLSGAAVDQARQAATSLAHAGVRRQVEPTATAETETEARMAWGDR